jgi:hypothetical protein
MDKVMKSTEPRSSFPVPRTLGRSRADFKARIRKGKGQEYSQQLELFQETLTPRARVQVYAMMAMADQKQPDQRIYARIADIARAMGYGPTASGQLAGHIFQDIEDIGIRLRRKEVALFFRTPTGRTKKGKMHYRTESTILSILQSFGFHYEDEDGKPINLDNMPKDKLLPIPTIDGAPLYAIPIMDENGEPVRNKDGSIRRQRANGVHWRFNSDLAAMMKNKRTSWIIFADVLKILTKYVSQPSTFNLMEQTLFWKRDSLIEMCHETLIDHLDIRGKDQDQNNRAVDAAFKAMLDEGIIDHPVQVRPPGYYKPTPKTGRERRKGMVYQWRPGKRWRVGKSLPSILAGDADLILPGEDQAESIPAIGKSIPAIGKSIPAIGKSYGGK